MPLLVQLFEKLYSTKFENRDEYEKKFEEFKKRLLLIGAAVLILIGAALIFKPKQSKNKYSQFISGTLRLTEVVWKKLVPEYEPVNFVLYRNNTIPETCSNLPPNADPFYCVEDRTIYFNENTCCVFERAYPPPANFPTAFVIAHEVGHQVQQFNGAYKKFRQLIQNASSADSAKYKLLLELQADFLAGVWAHHANKMKDSIYFEPGDMEQGLVAIARFGDNVQFAANTYQQSAHGTPQQRIYWFKHGYETGDLNRGDLDAMLLSPDASMPIYSVMSTHLPSK